MDHALRSISYIADIGDLLVIMARRRIVPTEGEEMQVIGTTPKMICHVFESEEVRSQKEIRKFSAYTHEIRCRLSSSRSRSGRPSKWRTWSSSRPTELKIIRSLKRWITKKYSIRKKSTGMNYKCLQGKNCKKR